MGVALTASRYLVPDGLLVQVAHGPEKQALGLVQVGLQQYAAVAVPVATQQAAYGNAR
jgi:hypothetical protein